MVPCSRLAGRACRRITRRLLIVIGLAFLTGCGPSWTVRHWDVTIEVDTPAGPRNGRGVVETRARPIVRHSGPNGSSTSRTGSRSFVARDQDNHRRQTMQKAEAAMA